MKTKGGGREERAKEEVCVHIMGGGRGKEILQQFFSCRLFPRRLVVFEVQVGGDVLWEGEEE